jgi:hypothetical protein
MPHKRVRTEEGFAEASRADAENHAGVADRGAAGPALDTRPSHSPARHPHRRTSAPHAGSRPSPVTCRGGAGRSAGGIGLGVSLLSPGRLRRGRGARWRGRGEGWRGRGAGWRGRRGRGRGGGPVLRHWGGSRFFISGADSCVFSLTSPGGPGKVVLVAGPVNGGA